MRWIKLQQEIIKQDFFTWENMKYLDKPNFAVEEAKDYAALRRWARRFYPADEAAGGAEVAIGNGGSNGGANGGSDGPPAS
jgi:hypothetical protein